ncbi:MAG TPA: adenylate kinase [Acidobacteriaceae bacterium]
MAEGAFTPGPILLMGAPGVGKGTQAKAMVAAWGIPQISTGDLLRANMAAKTELGRQAKELVDQGVLVPDALVNEMVAERLTQPDTARGYILDGFPRTLGQAEWLDGHLEGGAAGLPVVAVNLRVEYTQLLRRVTGRRMCPACGSIYNVYLHPPKVEGVCDLDGSPLMRRQDDTEAVFEGRLRAYHEQTAPVVEHYRQAGRLRDVDGEQPVEEVTRGMLDAVRQMRRA